MYFKYVFRVVYFVSLNLVAVLFADMMLAFQRTATLATAVERPGLITRQIADLE
jgi:hypothetical protein